MSDVAISVGVVVIIVVLVVAFLGIGIYGGIRGLRVGNTCNDQTLVFMGIASIVGTLLTGPIGMILGIITWVMANEKSRKVSCAKQLKKEYSSN